MSSDRGLYVVLNREKVEDALMRGGDLPLNTRLHTSAKEVENACWDMNEANGHPGKFQVYWLVPVEV